MELENPKIKEGINTTQENPLKEFFQLTLGIVAIAITIIVLLHFSIGYFAKLIPFDFERQMVQDIESLQPRPSEQQKYLQALADDIAIYMDLPADMSVTIHYDSAETVNALATLGGHIFVYQGLIDNMPDENTLSMVIAHEIAHIKHRHPIVAAGKGLTLMVLAAAITGASGSSAGEALLGQSINLSLLSFSRDQERKADLEALKAINDYYGHVSGAKTLFSIFSDMPGSIEKSIPEFLRSHPVSEQRWQTLRDYALQHNFVLDGPVKPLEIPENKPLKEHN